MITVVTTALFAGTVETKIIQIQRLFKYKCHTKGKFYQTSKHHTDKSCNILFGIQRVGIQRENTSSKEAQYFIFHLYSNISLGNVNMLQFCKFLIVSQGLNSLY